ncbi:ATP synthase regulation protein NCA2-domain-containing protein [Helicostylum pulchrum]|uniref:Uncharacterized protein n=1 Tax=Helicostylum pulchrum TaxID=562976 RepID=A0ABP9Y575_9FUNG|nr:ATP synthase regulation protein NCA2-domain-containing protein [Helicostylum pulchrum]
MTDFVQEQLNKLNNTLLDLFQHQNLNSLPLSSLTTDPLQALHQDQNVELFTRLASRDIDLTNTPDIELLQKYLKLYQPTTNVSLDWLFITKCIVAIYGFLLKNILNSTLPLSQAIQYWNGIYGSRRYEAYYALQTLPIRIGYLGINTVKKMRTTHLGLKNLIVDSPEHLFLNMFPMHARDWIKQEKSFRFFSAKKASIFKQLIHEEIRQKIHALDLFRTRQASRLGLLIKLTPFMTMTDNNDIAAQSGQCLSMMKHILIPLTSIKTINDFQVNETLDYIETSSTLQPNEIAKELLDIIDDWNNKCHVNITSIKDIYGPPSLLTRYWIPAVVGYFAGNTAIQIITEKQDDIIEWFSELGITAKDFCIHWIWEPVLQVWDTIRLKDEKLSILGKEGLRSDIESLERMLYEFARDRYHMPDSEINNIVQNVRGGDMSFVLKAYEAEIKHPFRNAIHGDLVQTLLIQVQKTKVDVDLAMTALDKLLKSNELNFAFLAVAPSMLITWGALSWLKRIWQRRSGRNIGLIGLPIRQTMRRIERLFNLSSDSNTLDCESQGILLCEVHLLRSYSLHLSMRNSIRELFIEDLRDLENPRLTVKQKLETIERMTRSWSFLRPCHI